ncbi:unnamed protein product, partial [Laminaria digitata]
NHRARRELSDEGEEEGRGGDHPHPRRITTGTSRNSNNNRRQTHGNNGNSSGNSTGGNSRGSGGGNSGSGGGDSRDSQGTPAEDPHSEMPTQFPGVQAVFGSAGCSSSADLGEPEARYVPETLS